MAYQNGYHVIGAMVTENRPPLDAYPRLRMAYPLCRFGISNHMSYY